jgi:hypothetical protein
VSEEIIIRRVLTSDEIIGRRLCDEKMVKRVVLFKEIIIRRVGFQ